MDSSVDNRPWPFSLLVGFFFAVIFLMLLPTLMLAPTIVLLVLVILNFGLFWALASTLLAGPLFVFSVCTFVLLSKYLFMPKVHPGIYAIRSGFGLRKWITDQTMALSLGLTNGLYATLYLVPFLRML